jgi:hypothetical protein
MMMSGGRGGGSRALHAVSLVYQLVSNVPASSAELEERKSLAVMAALGGGGQETVAGLPATAAVSVTAEAATSSAGSHQLDGPGETFIERYSRGISAVDTILFLDRLRQSVAVKEALKAAGKQGLLSSSMRKTVSVPNFSSVLMTGSRSMDNLASSAWTGGAAASTQQSAAGPRLGGPRTMMRTSMSVNDFDQPELLSLPLAGRPGGNGRRARQGLATVPETDQSGSGSGGGDGGNPGGESLTRPTFLNLAPALSTREEEPLREGGGLDEYDIV